MSLAVDILCELSRISVCTNIRLFLLINTVTSFYRFLALSLSIISKQQTVKPTNGVAAHILTATASILLHAYTPHLCPCGLLIFYHPCPF